MGLFDTIKFSADSTLSCPGGHPLISFQTKDLDCEMGVYLVHDSKLYNKLKLISADDNDFGYNKLEIGDYSMPDTLVKNALILHKTDVAVRHRITGKIHIYTSCRKCRPVLIAGTGWSPDRIQEDYLWVEFEAAFEDGELVNLERKTADRNALQVKLKAQGALVIDDDNPIAIAHFYKLGL